MYWIQGFEIDLGSEIPSKGCRGCGDDRDRPSEGLTFWLSTSDARRVVCDTRLK